ncbi:rRNA pseudouridine synthase, partial [bacterium]|nr:rRNA pseudouridine synthase [bacterium]
MRTRARTGTKVTRSPKSTEPSAAPNPTPEPERLQKFLSRAGVASRRAAEELILAGRVTVNGAVVSTLGEKIVAGRDEVVVDGTRIEPPATLWYLMLNKPAGVVTTLDDPQGRPTVARFIPAGAPRWGVPAG